MVVVLKKAGKVSRLVNGIRTENRRKITGGSHTL